MENRSGSGLMSWFRLASQTRRESTPPPPQQPQAPMRGAPVRQASLFARLQEDAAHNQQSAGQITRNPPPPPPVTAPPPPTTVVKPQPPAPAPKQADQVPQRGPPLTAQRGNGDNSPTLTPPPPPRVVASPTPPKAAVRTPTPPPEPVVLIKTIVPATPVPNQTSPLATQTNGIGLEDSIGRDKMKLNSNTQAEPQKVFVPNPHADTRNLSPSSPKKPINGKKDEDMMRVITMSGHNQGAIMDLSAAGHHLRGLQQAKASGSDLKDGESNEKKEEKNSNNWFLAAGKKKTPVVSLTNSNVQCVNNSILFNASSIQRDPGVHINFTRRRPMNSTPAAAAAAAATSGSVIQSSQSSNRSSTE